MLFCSDDAQVLASLIRFLSAAVQGNRAALVVATARHRTQTFHQLRVLGIAIDAAVSRGMCVVWDADTRPDPWAFVETITSLQQAAATYTGNTRSRVVIWGERAGRLWAAGERDEAIALERFASELTINLRVNIVCTYPVRATHGEISALAHICAEHTTVLSG